MTYAWNRSAAITGIAALMAAASSQIPDLLNSFEMGGRAMGMGGALYSNASDASASYWNPAGLGHITTTQAELNFRNRPTTDTALTGTFVDPDRDGSAGVGSNAITFGGLALPTRGGVIGLSYAVGGWARELAEGTDLSSGDPKDPTRVSPQREFLKVVNEFITLGYGIQRRGGMNVGAGVVFARQHISNRIFIRTVDEEGNEIGITESDISEAGQGIGGIVGVQFTPPANPNVSIGISYRSEIAIDGLAGAEAFSEAIPARLQGGIVWRVDGLRGGRDYLVGGADVAYFFSANGGKILRRDAQISAGLGFEYNLSQGFGYLPIRLGFRTTDSGGPQFAARDVVTFGLGYRPREGDYWLDLALAAASGQSRPDLALSMSFVVGK